MLAKPWIKCEDGVLINLNYIIKIVRIDVASPVSYGICLFHASAGQSKGAPTGTQKLLYADEATADAAFQEIQDFMSAQGAVHELQTATA